MYIQAYFIVFNWKWAKLKTHVTADKAIMFLSTRWRYSSSVV